MRLPLDRPEPDFTVSGFILRCNHFKHGGKQNSESKAHCPVKVSHISSIYQGERHVRAFPVCRLVKRMRVLFDVLAG